MNRLLQFLWKYRARQLVVTLAFALACPWYLAQGGEWPYLVLVAMLVYGAFFAVLVEGRIRMERQVAGHLLTMGRMLVHNSTHFVQNNGLHGNLHTELVQDGAPTNAAWERAAWEIKRKGHLHDDVSVKWDRRVGAVVINWIG